MANPKKLIRKVLPKSVIIVAERSYRKGRGIVWRTRYGFPARGMKVIAITGTNGKTTTASYVNAMLNHAGLKTAVYTTAYLEINGEHTPNRTHMTVSSQAAVQRFFAQARAAQVDWVILEVTSHALDQGRIDGVKIEVAIITNLTQEHLDYHKTMEAYAGAKARLLGTTYGARTCILNADDAWFDFFSAKARGNVVSFGENQAADLQLTDLQLTTEGSRMNVVAAGAATELRSPLIGKFNAYNALAAYGAGLAVGLSPQTASAGIQTLTSVPGRMEPITAGQDFSVVVDFAITPDALENALTALQAVTTGDVIIVFGATGDRDKTKRAPMGEVVGRLADRIFLTDDETYTEDPESIRQQVYEGIETANAQVKTTVVDDRRQAIRQAFAAAKTGDTVLLTGIGNEDYRNMGGQKQPWDERDVARAELNQS